MYQGCIEMAKIVNLSKMQTQNIKNLYGLWNFADACLDLHVLIVVCEDV